MGRFAIGVDLGGTKVEACLVDETRTILARKRRPSEPGLGRERVVQNILGLIDETAGEARYEAVGMGTPGTYSATDDIMYGAPHTPLYEKPGLVSLLRSKLTVPLIVENDANCLALAEFFAQCYGRYSTVMAVILGTGMGAGLILGNRLHRGPNGNAGEIGHTSIATAVAFVEVYPTHGAKALAIVLAHWIAGQGEQELLPDDRIEVDDLSGVRLLIHFVDPERARRARGRVALAWPFLARATSVAGHEGHLKVERHVDDDRRFS